MSYKSPEEVIAAFHALPLAQQVKVMRLLMEWQYSDDLQHDIHYAIEMILKGDTQCPQSSSQPVQQSSQVPLPAGLKVPLYP